MVVAAARTAARLQPARPARPDRRAAAMQGFTSRGTVTRAAWDRAMVRRLRATAGHAVLNLATGRCHFRRSHSHTPIAPVST